MFDSIVIKIQEAEEVDYWAAVERTVAYLESDHVRQIPTSRIRAELFAEVAVAMRGPHARVLRASDVRDIDHLATGPAPISRTLQEAR